MVLGRLAVDRAYQDRGLDAGLFRDAILRTVQAAELAGIRASLVHAISEEAKRFYARRGFVESPIDPMTLMITVATRKKPSAAGRSAYPGPGFPSPSGLRWSAPC
jgi:hypothetical protein